MSRDPEDLELDGDITISCQPLKFTQAEDLLPDMIGIGGIVLTQASSALDEIISVASKSSLRKLDINAVVSALGPLLTALAERLKAGELKRLAPLLLNSTAVVFPDDKGVKMRLELSKKSEREQTFEEHPELYFIALGFAAKVTFSKYFPAIGPVVTKLKSLMATMMKAPSHPETES